MLIRACTVILYNLVCFVFCSNEFIFELTITFQKKTSPIQTPYN
uniref:Uncharacterized protein n=1 Tax=Arundo donax TaxID=35708 RepID=A0A0A9ABT2_ARUDO